MHEGFAAQECGERAGRTRLMQRTRKEFGIVPRKAAMSDGADIDAIIEVEDAKRCLAQMQGLFKHRIEHRREVAGRGVDDLSYLSCRGLLFQSLARLGN